MKEKLAKCFTIEDSWNYFQSLDSLEITKFVNALENAKNYVELTVRDNFLLEQAKHILTKRGY